MASVLSYGIDSSIELDLPSGVLVGHCGQPQGSTLDDPGRATADSLADPLGYPPLKRSLVPGDRVAIALGPEVPRAGEIVAAIVECLIAGGVDAESIGLLRAGGDADSGLGDPRPWLAPEVGGRIRLVTHDPNDRDKLAYLAATDRGDAILLNREIADADVVLPVGCYRRRAVAGHFGMYAAVFPQFADSRSQIRFRSPATLGSRGYHKKQVIEAVGEVGWLLGSALSVQVIPGPGGSALHVLAGEVGAVEREGRRLYEAAWRWSVPRRAALVVATIEGNSHEQTWQNLGRAAVAASEAVQEDGVIALCTDLAESPGPGVNRLRGSRSREEALMAVRRERPQDALAVAQLAWVQERVQLYLLSRLADTDVEELEIAPVAGSEELARLARRHESCLLLENAPYAMVKIQGG
jgi:nickel-dependent lactate racemase